MALGEDASIEASEPPSAADPGESHDPETLFILDSIVQRLKPRDAHHVSARSLEEEIAEETEHAHAELEREHALRAREQTRKEAHGD